MKDVGQQIAALPLAWHDNELRILMVTSRDTGRWVVPKGWTMAGCQPWKAAKIEALEEAGARGPISTETLGEYRYKKVLDDGSKQLCRVRVYPMLVEGLEHDWKERDQRTRRWFSPKAAAKSVVEPDLAKLMRGLAKKPKKQPVIGALLRQ